MRLEGRVLKIWMAILFVSVCLFIVSAGKEDPGIRISDSLTLHSGDVITLQADDNTYVTCRDIVSCLPTTIFTKKTIRNCLTLTGFAIPDSYSEFIVEIENDKKNQIRLRDKTNRLYLRFYEDSDSFWRECVDFPFILIGDTSSSYFNTFTIMPIREGNKISLQAANQKYLKRYIVEVPVKPVTYEEVTYKMISPLADTPNEYAIFTIFKKGIDPDFEQYVSDAIFDYANSTIIPNPTIVASTYQLSDGPGGMNWSINGAFEKKTIDKWTWQKGVELTKGTTLTGNLNIKRIPGIELGGAATRASTDKTFSTATNEQAEEVINRITWTQGIQIPANTLTRATLVANETTISIPFTAKVEVRSKFSPENYIYLVKGDFQTIRYVNVRVYKKSEPLTPELRATIASDIGSIPDIAYLANNWVDKTPPS